MGALCLLLLSLWFPCGTFYASEIFVIIVERHVFVLFKEYRLGAFSFALFDSDFGVNFTIVGCSCSLVTFVLQ